jgi:ABC-type lipoprotein release transport system permease subunit
MYFVMAWRNIWRNRRRTGVILTAVVIGVWSMISLSALMRGVGDRLLKNNISTLTGHIQIHKEGYRNDPVIENSIENPSEVDAVLKKNLPDGTRWAPRIRVSAVASNARHSSGVVLLGIQPEREKDTSFIGNAVFEGKYLNEGDSHGILVGKALAEKFDTSVGKKLVLMSQDTGKEISSRAFRVAGIYRAEMESTEKQFVFVSMESAKTMLRMGDGISEISILFPREGDTHPAAATLKKNLGEKELEVMTWDELLPLTVAILKMYDWFIFLWFLVIFIAMAFGVVNTTLMAVFERMREFGLLKALGMKPGRIIGEVLTESSIILILGIAIGNLTGYLTIFALKGKGIDLSALSSGLEFIGLPRIIYPVYVPGDAVVANCVVFFLGLLVSLYPAVKASRISPVEAMAHT